MDKEEYVHNHETLYGFGVSVIGVDYKEMLISLRTSQAVGPLIDPTLYRASSEATDASEKMLKAGIALQEAAVELAAARARYHARREI